MRFRPFKCVSRTLCFSFFLLGLAYSYGNVPADIEEHAAGKSCILSGIVEADIERNWHPAAGDTKLRRELLSILDKTSAQKSAASKEPAVLDASVRFRFKVDSSQHVSESVVESSSGLRDFDSCALKAAKQAFSKFDAPLEPGAYRVKMVYFLSRKKHRKSHDFEGNVYLPVALNGALDDPFGDRADIYASVWESVD